MRQSISNNLFLVELSEQESSFVQKIMYDIKKDELSVFLKGIGERRYADVPLDVFMEFSTASSFGSFFHSNIKNKFTMAKSKASAAAPPPPKQEEKRKPKKINRASDVTRYIEIDIDLKKIEKDWLYKTDSGRLYAKLKLVMRPDGEVDQYGNLGFVSQTVPTEIYKVDKTVKGPILGNACELLWEHEEEEMHRVTEDDDDDITGGLPF